MGFLISGGLTMARPTQESALKRMVRTPQYRMRVERDKTKYTRQSKHKKRPADSWVFYCSKPASL